jgi:2-methylcitrate dehydratase PrpD
VYCLAAALVEGDLQSAQFEPRCLEDPRILGLIDKISTAPDAEFSSYWPRANPAGVEIIMTSGEVHRADHLYSPGHPENLMTDDQLANKFRTQAATSVAADRIDGIIAAVRDVRKMDNIQPLMAMVSSRG